MRGCAADFDTYLAVRTPSGEVLISDDFHLGTDSSLDFYGEAGAYRVEPFAAVGGVVVEAEIE